MNIKFLLNLETFFMALADKTRLRILSLLREREISVGFFSEVLGESQPKISRHLAYLRNAGLVDVRRDGKCMHYRLVHPHDEYAAQILEDTLNWLYSDEEIQEDYKKLTATFSMISDRGSKSITYAKPNMSHDHVEQLEIFLL